jgi:hypothetical protein
MDLGREIIVESGRGVSQEAQDQNPENKNSKDSSGKLSSVEKVLAELPFLLDIVKFIAAVAVASLVYFVASVFISDEMNYFLRHFLCLTFSIMALFAFNTVQKSVPIIGRAVIVLLFIFFIYKITDHYFGQPKENRTENETRKQTSKPAVSNILVLYPGIHPFELEDSASSVWLTIPPTGRYRYAISSPSYSYKIVFPDGRAYQGDPKAIIPWNQRPVFRLVGSKKETILVEITEI